MFKNKTNIFRTIKWVGISYLITLTLIFIYALMLTYTSIPESTMPTCVLIISMLSILIASSLSVKKIKEKGLINGITIGLSYITILYILSSFFVTGFGLNTYSLLTIILCTIIGAVGGIVGVNL